MRIEGRTFESLVLHAYAVQEGVPVLSNWERPGVVEADGVTVDGVLLEASAGELRVSDLREVERKRRLLELDEAVAIVPVGVRVSNRLHRFPRVEVWRAWIDPRAWGRVYATHPGGEWPEAWRHHARWSHLRFRLLSGPFVKVDRTPRTFSALARIVEAYNTPPAQMWQSVLSILDATNMSKKGRQYHVRPSASPLGLDVEDVHHTHQHRINTTGHCERCQYGAGEAGILLVRVLRDLGFRRILATWSGSRGFHVYAMDFSTVWEGGDALDMPTQANARQAAFQAILEAEPHLEAWLDPLVTGDPMRIMKVPGSIDRSGCVVGFVPTDSFISFRPHTLISHLVTLRRDGVHAPVCVPDGGLEAVQEVRR